MMERSLRYYCVIDGTAENTIERAHLRLDDKVRMLLTKPPEHPSVDYCRRAAAAFWRRVTLELMMYGGAMNLQY